MARRKSMTKTTRFEVFKRDKFTCQYCGRKAPDVILEIEHIQPVSKGGDNDLMNLVTSCEGCNDGKAARELGDDAVVERARKQVEALQERREQIEMMLEWKEGLRDIDEYAAVRLGEYILQSIPGFSINDSGYLTLKKWLARFSMDELTSAVDISMRQYLVVDAEGKPTNESVSKAWEFIGRIARVRREGKDSPELREIFYARGIARRRCGYFNDAQALVLLRDAYDLGADITLLTNMARRCSCWSQWRDDMASLIADLEKER